MENNRNNKEVAFNMLDFFLLIAKWKRFLFLNTFIISVAAIITSLLLPKYYIAYSTIMPPKNDKLGLSNLMAGIPLKGLLGGDLGESGAENVYLAILQSTKSKKALNGKRRNPLFSVVGHQGIEPWTY